MNDKRDLVFPFLPKTTGGGSGDPESGYQFSGSPGKWHRDTSVLSKLPSDLIVGKDRVESKLLTSIPDVWARAHFFHRALLDARHPGHDDVVDEWRGLLALICFSETYALNLTVDTIDLEELGVSGDGNPPIAGPLLDTAPSDAFKRFCLIKADGILVGATSPFSFVYTPPDYKVPEIIPWHDMNGRLIDPTNYFARRGGTYQQMLATLKGWIENLHGLVDHLELSGGDGNLLAGLINQWASDIKVTAISVAATGVQVIRISGQNAVLRPLPAAKADGGEINSDVRIALGALRKEFLTGKHIPPIIYWKDGWKEGKLVYGLFDSQHIGEPQGDEGTDLADGRIDHPWINPLKLFFNDTITKVHLEPGSVRCRGGDQYLLPLKKEILRYFDSDFLESNFTLSVSQDKTVTATLRIPITGNEAAEIKREYPATRQVSTIDRDAVVLWPRFKLNDWKHYYLFARYPEKGAGEWTCECLGANVSASSEIKAERCHIARLDSPPEAISFWRGNDSLGVCIPRLQDPPGATGSQRWSVSVDFGTSNTTVAAMDKSVKVPETLNFKPQHLFLMALPEGSAMMLTVSKSFFAANEMFQSSPFPSVYYPFHIIPNAQAVLNGTIPFEPVLLAFGDTDQYSRDYRTGLKWDMDEVALEVANQFLTQTLIMALLETRLLGAKEIDIRWTYPSSFEKKRRMQFESAWRAITDALRRSTGLDLHLPETSAEDGDPTITESVAVCQYARTVLGMTPASSNLALLTVDIGGATSDIAIWLESKIIAQASLLIGADILTECIHDTKAFRDLWLDWAKLSEEPFHDPWEDALTKKNFRSAVNECLRFRNEDIKQGIRQRAGVGPDEKRFLSLVLCSHGAIAYYSGLLLRSAIDSDGDLAGIDVLLSGNGARSLEWLGEDKFYIPVLKQFMAAGFGQSKAPLTISVVLSQEPKQEVAKGILCQLPFDGSIPVPRLTLGEDSIEIGGEHCDRFSDLVSVSGDKLAGSQIVVSGDLPVHRAFVALYNDIAEKKNLLEIGHDLDFARIQAAIQQQLWDYSRSPESISMVPPFVTGVKWILKHLSGQDSS